MCRIARQAFDTKDSQTNRTVLKFQGSVIIAMFNELMMFTFRTFQGIKMNGIDIRII